MLDQRIKEAMEKHAATIQHIAQPLLLRINAAVAFSGLSRSTLYRLIGAGEIIGCKQGKTRFIKTQSLIDYIERMQ